MGFEGPFIILALVSGVAGFIVYFLPTILGRHKTNVWAIFALNFFLGWTLVGWVVALVWAISPDNKPIVYYNNNNFEKPNYAQPPIVKTDELLKFKQLLDAGAITQEEYDKEKGRILNS